MIVLYTDSECTEELTDNSIQTIHNGFLGEADFFTIYLKNDNNAESFSNVKVEIEIAPELIGWSSKVFLGNEGLSEEEWSEAEEDVIIDSISDTNTVYSIQCRIYCPAGENSRVIKGDKVFIKVTGVQND